MGCVSEEVLLKVLWLLVIDKSENESGEEDIEGLRAKENI